MSRSRLFVPGLSQHVHHRGNNRSDVFRDDDDRHVFLTLLQRYAPRHGVAVHGYVLMTTHYHAQVTPFEESSLPRMMQSLISRYVRYFNDRHHRTGTLWEGRYRSCLIDEMRYWLVCLRYIEMNPVRAGIASSPGEYRWSSHAANAKGAHDPILTPHELYLQLAPAAGLRRERWADVCAQPTSERDVACIRAATRVGERLTTEADPAADDESMPGVDEVSWADSARPDVASAG